MYSRNSLVVMLMGAAALMTGCDSDGGPAEVDLDEALAAVVAERDLQPMTAHVESDAELVKLGQMLFFDPELSGNRDVACATCHHPTLGTGDALSLSIGVGGEGLGAERLLGEGRTLIPRNAPEVFNRGHHEWHTLFWDGRVSETTSGEFVSPAGDALPDGLHSVLAVQAMFPVTSADEMRGAPGDVDVNGEPNELAEIDDDDVTAIWAALMARLMAIDEYDDLFSRAYPDLAADERGFQHAANAMAAFEIDAFTFTDAPWDRYLRGDTEALDDAAKRGALLFYGDAGCAGCHSGTLFTDQKHHSVCTPQIGPGKDEDGTDLGRARVTGSQQDAFAFRTPPLRNVTLTGPWMHSGAYTELEAAVRHMASPAESLKGYDVTQLRADLQSTFQVDNELLQAMFESLSPLLAVPPDLDDADIADLVAFLGALTDPAAEELEDLVPESVPSGLAVDR